MKSNFIIAIVGPTAAGKSRLAMNLAVKFNGEIINCDSMQVYRGLDIGTGKPSNEDRKRVKHHLIDIAETSETFSAGTFKTLADIALSEILDRGNLPFLVGGTGLYYRAFMKTIFSAPPAFPLLRKALEEIAEKKGLLHLYNILIKIDSPSKSNITPRDKLRIIRALEIYITTNKTKSDLIIENPFGKDRFKAIKIGLTLNRKILYNQIEERIDEMINSGWIDEVKRLSDEERLIGQAEKAIGYMELAQYVKGKATIEDTTGFIKIRTKHLAKRQMTWFKKEDGIIWIDASEEHLYEKVRKIILNAMEGKNAKRD